MTRQAPGNPSTPRRLVFRLRTLLGLPVVAALLMTLIVECGRAVNSGFWVGRKDVTLPFLIVDETTNNPIPQAEVWLIEPGNSGAGPVKGLTGQNGRVDLQNSFYARGSFGVGETTHVGFHPWLVRVLADGYRSFVAALEDFDGPPPDGSTDPPLRLYYPVPREIGSTPRNRGASD
jgi:hypothetical protein